MLPIEANEGDLLTSTATVIELSGEYGPTSEFSECVQIAAAECVCPQPIPDFVPNDQVDPIDLMALIDARHAGDMSLDITGDNTVSGPDFFLFSCCWYEVSMP